MTDTAEKWATEQFPPDQRENLAGNTIWHWMVEGFEAGVLEASPSEEEVLNAAWQIGQNHYWTLGGHHDGKWLDLRGYAALAALRTTPEEEDG